MDRNSCFSKSSKMKATFRSFATLEQLKIRRIGNDLPVWSTRVIILVRRSSYFSFPFTKLESLQRIPHKNEHGRAQSKGYIGTDYACSSIACNSRTGHRWADSCSVSAARSHDASREEEPITNSSSGRTRDTELLWPERICQSINTNISSQHWRCCCPAVRHTCPSFGPPAIDSEDIARTRFEKVDRGWYGSYIWDWSQF